MAFVIDDATIVAATEVAETSAKTVAEGVSEDIIVNQFEECIFSIEDSDLIKEVSPEYGMDNTFSENVSEQIEKEFAPEVFQNNQQVGDLNNAAPTEVEKIERTSTFEDQTIDNFELEKQRLVFENKLYLGQPHDADVLRNNLETAMNKDTDKSVSRAHHIVGNETPNAANKLAEFGIDRNDPANGILLPHDVSSPLKGAIHSGRHLQDYYNTVEQRISQAYTKEEVLEVLQSIKEDLFSGNLFLQRDVQPNK